MELKPMELKLICKFCERPLKYMHDEKRDVIIVSPCYRCTPNLHKDTGGAIYETEEMWKARIAKHIDNIIKKIYETKTQDDDKNK